MPNKTIKMPVNRCISATEQFLKENEKIKIERKTSSLIEFKKGENFQFSISPKDVSLKGRISFEGNGETNVNLIYDRNDSVYFYAIFTPLSIGLGIFFIFFPYLLGTTSGFIPLFFLIMGILIIISAIIAPIEAFYLLNKGSDLFSDELFIYLTNQALQPSIQPTREEATIGEHLTTKVIIKERVKVTYTLPSNCPNCKANLKYEEIIMKSPDKAECAYCGSIINLIEKEI